MAAVSIRAGDYVWIADQSATIYKKPPAVAMAQEQLASTTVWDHGCSINHNAR